MCVSLVPCSPACCAAGSCLTCCCCQSVHEREHPGPGAAVQAAAEPQQRGPGAGHRPAGEPALQLQRVESKGVRQLDVSGLQPSAAVLLSHISVASAKASRRQHAWCIHAVCKLHQAVACQARFIQDQLQTMRLPSPTSAEEVVPRSPSVP